MNYPKFKSGKITILMEAFSQDFESDPILIGVYQGNRVVKKQNGELRKVVNLKEKITKGTRVRITFLPNKTFRVEKAL